MAFCNYVARSIYSTFSSRHRLLAILPLSFFFKLLFFAVLYRPNPDPSRATVGPGETFSRGQQTFFRGPLKFGRAKKAKI